MHEYWCNEIRHPSNANTTNTAAADATHTQHQRRRHDATSSMASLSLPSPLALRTSLAKGGIAFAEPEHSTSKAT